MNDNAHDLSLKSVMTMRKKEGVQGYTKFKNSALKFSNNIRIMREKKSSLNLVSSNFDFISPKLVIKI